MINWITIIRDLRRAGWRYIDIAMEIDSSEYWVSRIARGRTRIVDYNVGARLLALHSRETAKLQVEAEIIR